MSTCNWGELTHLRFVGWTTKYILIFMLAICAICPLNFLDWWMRLIWLMIVFEVGQVFFFYSANVSPGLWIDPFSWGPSRRFVGFQRWFPVKVYLAANHSRANWERSKIVARVDFFKLSPNTHTAMFCICREVSIFMGVPPFMDGFFEGKSHLNGW